LEEIAKEPDPKRWNLEEGDEIVPGRYALRRLGGGRSYEAYLTWDDRLFGLVVAKLVRPHLVDGGPALRGLAREAEVAGRLNHPVIVRVFDAVLEGHRPHLLLEHLEGPRLSSLIRRYGRVELEQLVPLALQICSALHYMGVKEVVHLDVKSSNVIMGAPPRLIDFSVARSIADARAITGAIGTDQYMAPEQCDPTQAHITGAADVWGLGATLWHAITGSVPFPRAAEYDADDPSRRWPQLHDDPAPLDERVPPVLAEILHRCLDKNPHLRPTPAEVAEALEPIVAALPTRPVLRRMRPRLR
jgi:serine/threonine protein kinase